MLGLRDQTAQMQAFRKLSQEPGHVATHTVTVPEPGSGEVLVKIAGCGICGSDLHAVQSDPGYDMMQPPVVLGHELAGTIVAVGPNTVLRGGDRVVAVSTQGCGGCRLCHSARPQLCGHRRIIGIHYDGGLADYVRIAARHLVPVPDGLDLVDAALAEPLSVAVHAVLERSCVVPGMRVVVTGPGTIGLLCARLALAAGARVLVLGTDADVSARLRLAHELGAATASLSQQTAAEAITDQLGGHSADLWLEASGAVPAFDAAVAHVAPGGQITVIAQYAHHVGMFIPDLLRREVTLAFSYAANPAAYATALDLLASDTVPAKKFITTYPLDAVRDALDDVTAGRVIKAIVTPEGRRG